MKNSEKFGLPPVEISAVDFRRVSTRIKPVIRIIRQNDSVERFFNLVAAVHPYPTIGEINKKVAGTYFSPKIFSERIQRDLKFFFHLKGRACGEQTCSA